MLIVSRGDRCECSKVVSELHEMRNKCAKDKSYSEIGIKRVAIFRLHLMLLKRSIRQVNRFVNSHGLAVSAISLCLYIMALLRRRPRRSRRS